jgi:DNA-binding transcriptional LysR family regulator
MDLNRLAIFREVGLTGSFSKAALKLRQPKSRISRNIAALERELGVQLIQRTTRQMQLTAAGRELLERAVPLLGQLEAAVEGVAGGAEEIAGELRVTVPDDLGVEVMGRICHRFMAQHPRVLIDLHVSNQMVDLVRDGFDLAVRIGKLRDASLLQTKVGQIGLAPYAAPQLRQRLGERVKPEDLSRLPHLVFMAASDSGRPMVKLQRRGEMRSIEVPVVFRSNNFFVLRAMVLEGAGVAALPQFIVREALRERRLVPLLQDWALEGATVQVVYPQQRELPARTRAFVQHLRESLTEVL